MVKTDPNCAEAASSHEYRCSQDICNASQLNSQTYEEQPGVQLCIDSTVVEGDDEYYAGTTKRDESVVNNVRREEYMCEENVSTVECENKLCKPDKRGHCCVHGTKMKTQSISSKKWADKGGTKGFGWKYFKTKKYLCMDAIEARKHFKKPVLPSNTCIEAGILGERFGDYTSDVVGGRLDDNTITILCSGEKVSAD